MHDTTIPVARRNHAAVVVDHSMVIFGGCDDSGRYAPPAVYYRPLHMYVPLVVYTHCEGAVAAVAVVMVVVVVVVLMLMLVVVAAAMRARAGVLWGVQSHQQRWSTSH